MRKKVYLIYKQSGMANFEVVKIFSSKESAEVYCQKQNEIAYQEYDDWGLVEGEEYSSYEMKVEE